MRVARLVGNDRLPQMCRGRWRRLKKNDDHLGVTHVPTAAAKAVVKVISAQLPKRDASGKTMEFLLEMMDFELRMVDFVLKMMDFLLEMMYFLLKMVGSTGAPSDPLSYDEEEAETVQEVGEEKQYRGNIGWSGAA